MSADKPHPLIGRRVTHDDGHKGRVLAAQHVVEQYRTFDEYSQGHYYEPVSYWSILVELEDGRIMSDDAQRFTFDNPSIKPKVSPARPYRVPGKADAP